MLLALDQETYLGPARVMRIAANRVYLELSDRQLWAQLALPVPYQPGVDDIVLSVGRDDIWYVIGVLQTTSMTTITVSGDLAIRAPRGSIQLIAAQGIRIRSSEIKVVAYRLELVARAAFETFGSARRWITGSLQIRAGRIRTMVDSAYRVCARRIVERAEDDVKIDGRKIHLG